MKALVTVLTVALILTGCGSNSGSAPASSGGACSSSVLKGTWQHANGSSLTFNQDCTGTGSYCESNFTYPNVTAASGDALVTISNTNTRSGCSPAGAATACVYSISGNALAFNCGAGVSNYTR